MNWSDRFVFETPANSMQEALTDFSKMFDECVKTFSKKAQQYLLKLLELVWNHRKLMRLLNKKFYFIAYPVFLIQSPQKYKFPRVFLLYRYDLSIIYEQYHHKI